MKIIREYRSSYGDEEFIDLAKKVIYLEANPDKRITDCCTQWGVNYNRFNNFMFRLRWKKRTNPVMYEAMMPYVHEYFDGDYEIGEFVKVNKLNRSHFSEACSHLTFMDKYEELRGRIEDKIELPIEKPMTFVKVMAELPAPPVVSEPEHDVVEPQNDIEIVIHKGVKVSISPSVDSMKIIKIIELLKDL